MHSYLKMSKYYDWMLNKVYDACLVSLFIFFIRGLLCFHHRPDTCLFLCFTRGFRGCMWYKYAICSFMRSLSLPVSTKAETILFHRQLLSVYHELESGSGGYTRVQMSLKSCFRNCYLWRKLCYLLSKPDAERSLPLKPPEHVRLRHVSVCKLTLTLTLTLTATLFNKLVAEDRSEKKKRSACVSLMPIHSSSLQPIVV